MKILDGNRCTTIVGLPDYGAPELLKGERKNK